MTLPHRQPAGHRRIAGPADRPFEVDRGSLLLQFGGDWDVLTAVVDVFLAEYAEQLAAVGRSVANRDPKAMSASAHRLRGSVSIFGADAAAETALRLEQAGDASTLTGTDEAYQSLQDGVEQLARSLRALLANGSFR